MPDDVTCTFCRKTVDSVEEAIDLGWLPTFFLTTDDDDTEESGTPICPDCELEHTFVGTDGTPVLKPGHVVPGIDHVQS